MSRYAYGYCGMPCALCTRYRTEGDSRCPGCSCDGYYTEPCKVHRCIREKGLDHCGQCGDFPCPKLGKMGPEHRTREGADLPGRGGCGTARLAGGI